MDSDYYTQTQNTPRSTGDYRQAGTILEVQMRNFMCHDNCAVKLNPRINFICGKNGSGKSAIQTAIAVGLGGKALATNRGSSLKALIKNDASSCTITIVMSNEGPLSYNQREYGHQIRVERHFSHTSGSYKIKNANGKIVSTERKELDRIINQFNIQTENPVCILHQDIARNFLNSSDPKNKYKFYLKASRFEDIIKLFSESALRVKATENTATMKFEVTQDAFKDVIEMKRKVKTLEDAREKRTHLEALENELVWAKIRESNMELEELQQKKAAEVASIKKVEAKLSKGEENCLGDKLKELEQRIQEMNSLVKDAKERLREAKQDFSNKQEDFSHNCSQISAIKQTISLIKRKHKSCLDEIENQRENAPEIKLKQERLKLELEKNEKTIETLKAAEENFAHEKQQLIDTEVKMEENLRTTANRLNDLLKEKKKREEQLAQICVNANNLPMYGSHMVTIAEEINKNRRKFEKEPIGPIGMHIKVRDPLWAGAVENFMYSTLTSFCVDNHRDAAVLANIFKNVCKRNPFPTILTSKFLNKVHDIRRNETGTRQYRNLAQALDIENPVVANCLIDQLEIESILLIPSNNEAYELLDEQHKVPPNCKRALTLTGDQFYPAPNYKSYSSARAVGHATLLQARQEDLIRELKNAIMNLSRQIPEAEAERRQAHLEKKDLLESLSKNEAELRTLRRQRFTVEQKINDLKTSIEPENQTNVGYLEEEAKVLETQLNKEAEKLKAQTTTFEELRARAGEAKKLYEGLQRTIAESDQEKAPLQAEIQHLKSTIQQASTKGDLLRKRINEHQDKLSEIETQITELTEHLQDDTENASQMCEPVNTHRSVAVINRELKCVATYLKRIEEENGGSLEQIQRNLAERQAEFENITQDLNSLRALIHKTSKSLRKRKQKELRLQHFLATSAKNNFQLYLNERNFDGKLEFDNEACSLTIKVQPQHRGSEGQDRSISTDTSSLSGGEKSFSTVCLIMALWQEIELPFHFLDEFDVFMDGINRRIVMDLLISYAKSVNQQFVFLTPLDMSSVNISDIVTVHRLEAPRQ